MGLLLLEKVEMSRKGLITCGQPHAFLRPSEGPMWRPRGNGNASEADPPVCLSQKGDPTGGGL